MLAAQNQNRMALEQLARRWCHEEMKDKDDIVPLQLQINENAILYKYEKMREIIFNEQVIIPVIRLLGSNISIFSSRSRGSGGIWGNLAERFCFVHWGSCLTYLLAFSLRRNSSLESSGEPINFWEKGKQNACVVLQTCNS